MKTEDIISMAREAGIEVDWSFDFQMRLERFAALVAFAEREACAQEAEKYGYDNFCGRFTDPIATAIRARGQA